MCVCVCVKTGRQAPAEAAAERVLMFRENVVTQGPRAEILEKKKVRIEKDIAKRQSSFSGHSTPRRRQCGGDLGTVCVRTRVEHVRDRNVARTV